ncbi:hypothetical protein EPYR_03311 [Erwinia pyrifoliae DSM 12163]|nr:hypothetical protein EPYR_03311 [Erwinia pyrifoliae DSM 12163]
MRHCFRFARLLYSQKYKGFITEGFIFMLPL